MNILGIKIDNVFLYEAVDRIDSIISDQPKTTQLVTTLNPEIALKAHSESDYKNILNKSALTTADGTGIIWAAKINHFKLKAKVTGVDLIKHLAKISPEKKWRWFLLGAKPGVAKKAANNLSKLYPGINIVKTDDGGIITTDNLSNQQNLVNKISNANIDILIVSLGAPTQERFIDYYKNRLNVKVAIGSGGTLDFIANVRKRAPKIFRIIGLEWLWRIILEPKRYKRIWNAVIIFPLTVYRNLR